MRFVTYRVKCFVWNSKEGGGPVEGFGFASDIAEDGAGIFLDIKQAKGAIVKVALEEETNASYRGVVIWCRRYSMDQRFVGQANLEYRVGIQFLFESEGERQRYLMQYNDLRKRVSSIPNDFKF
jgi:hypothetical protein